MILAVCAKDVVCIPLMAKLVFSVLWLPSLTMAADIVRGVRVAERKEVGACANDRAIFEMELQYDLMPSATGQDMGVGEIGNRS